MKNINAVRQPKFFDCLASDPKIQGGRVTANGIEHRFGLQKIHALEQFVETRDKKGNKIRPMGMLSDEQIQYFSAFDINFEPADLPGWFHPLTNFKLGTYYRQGY